MRTEKRKTNLADVSKDYHTHLKQKQLNKQKKKFRLISPSPVIGLTVGMCGTIGSIVAWLSKVPLLVVLLLSLLGCIGAAISRGDNDDYDSLAARVCMGAAAISLFTGIIILAVYLKSINLWEFVNVF